MLSQVDSEFGRSVQIAGSVLKLTNAEVSDRGLYLCHAINTEGSAKAFASIEVERKLYNL